MNEAQMAALRHLAADFRTAIEHARADKAPGAPGNPTKGTTAWSIGAADGKHFAPSKSTFMVNYRVEDLAALTAAS